MARRPKYLHFVPTEAKGRGQGLVLAGRLGQKTPHGISYVEAGQSMNGHAPGMPMEIFSAGTTDLDQFVMIVVDATKPFSSPAKFD